MAIKAVRGKKKWIFVQGFKEQNQGQWGSRCLEEEPGLGMPQRQAGSPEAGCAGQIPAPNKGCPWSSPRLATLFEGLCLVAKISCVNLGFWHTDQNALTNTYYTAFVKRCLLLLPRNELQKENNQFFLFLDSKCPSSPRRKEEEKYILLYRHHL